MTLQKRTDHYLKLLEDTMTVRASGKVTKVVEWFGYKLHLLVDVRHEVGLALRQTIYQGGRVAAGVNAAAAAVEVPLTVTERAGVARVGNHVNSGVPLPVGAVKDVAGLDLTSLKREEMRRLRHRMQVVFQDPYASLNPRMRIGDSIGHALLIHGLANRQEKYERVVDMMERVGLTHRSHNFAHQLSGGEKQRVNLARGLVSRPRLLLLDEPTASLDPKTTERVIRLIEDLKHEGVAMLAIFHHPELVARMADHVVELEPPFTVELSEKNSIKEIAR